MAGWELNPNSTVDWDVLEYVADDGSHVAWVEAFDGGERAYPWAYDVAKACYVRGGCFRTVESAREWAEQVCGVRPRTPEFSAHYEKFYGGTEG